LKVEHVSMTTDDLWLDEVQERSFNRANPATTSSLPTGNRMTGAQLVHLLRPGAYGVLATTRPDGRPHAAPTSLVLQDQAIWLPTVAGAVRLTNLAAHPWASLVVMRGEGTEHLMVTLEGPATIVDAEAEDVAPAARRHGHALSWVTAWIRLAPQRVFSYAATRAPMP
jgi:hypothetical protein